MAQPLVPTKDHLHVLQAGSSLASVPSGPTRRSYPTPAWPPHALRTACQESSNVHLLLLKFAEPRSSGANEGRGLLSLHGGADPVLATALGHTRCVVDTLAVDPSSVGRDTGDASSAARETGDPALWERLQGPRAHSGEGDGRPQSGGMNPGGCKGSLDLREPS